jgi:hypothetical protein
MSDIGRWRRVPSKLWHDAAFQGLNDGEARVCLYALTGPQSTSNGIYRMSTAVAVEDIGNLTTIEFDVRLDAVCAAFGWRFDPATRVLWIPTWLDENPPQSPNVCVAWRKLLVNLPDCDLKFEAAAAITTYLKDKPKAFLEAFGKDLPKDIRISKAKPKSQPEANQGAGDQGIQGSGKRGAGALRAARAEKGAIADNRLMPIAREVLKITGPDSDTEYRVNVFFDVAKHKGGMAPLPSSSDVVAALNQAASERSGSVEFARFGT